MSKSTNGFNLGEDKGFYIILFLCLAAIGVSGYVLFFTGPSENSEPNATIREEVEVPVMEPQFNIPVIEESSVDDVIKEEKPSVDRDTPNMPNNNSGVKDSEKTNNTSTGAKPQAEKPSTGTQEGQKKQNAENKPTALFVKPIAGDVVKAFSSDELVYDTTMGDWRVHLGTDFVAKQGDRVYAIASATVEDVYDDEIYGRSVLLDHGNDLKTLYTGLDEDVKFVKGASVKAGDVLGVVGDTGVSSEASGIHFHVEAIKSGIRIDVEELISSN